MKFLPLLLLTAALAACSRSTPGEPMKAGENAGGGEAVQLKEGHGLALHPKLRESIDLQVAEVSDQPVAAEFTAQLYVTGGTGGFQRVAFTPGSASGSEASGWLPADKAKLLQPGQEVDLRFNGTTEKGMVGRIEKAAFAALGEYEVVVETETPFNAGTRLHATFHAPAGDAVPAVPRAALLKTVEGWFVYAVNESFFLRTPVKIGAMNADFAEITEGLYAGDQIVTSPVETLWMAELQILRGGKACTCGH